MRDIAITLIVIVGCFYTLKKPYIGVLLWSWLGYMNPHRFIMVVCLQYAICASDCHSADGGYGIFQPNQKTTY